ncbi:trihelix transcription factor ASR3 isoform X2 [Zea mays]|uniref:Myb-like domain-containing protein n=1 Tax=Zea mays TaxID=4577 RepID=A0A804RIH9_MAIZE|nr:trihelix transcription factor ASR3 isoform X2 [Zea mays]|eukprot:XP_008663155.1 trihelix transcription factor ASR3 isoform X2 [Zea mays]
MSNAGEARGVGTGRGSRLPRWTRQEILVLVEGKRVVEGSGRGRGRGRVRGGEGAEPTKWAAVAEYCRRHGVDRGPVQCRKRWSNLAGDYKKIREWERGYAARKEASFWDMRNDARRERRLPGFFDREVYDILEGRAGGNAAALEDVDGKEEEAKAVVHAGRAVQRGGLFSSSEDEDDQEEDAATPSPTPAPAAVAVPIPGEQAVAVPSFLEMARASSLSVHVTEKTTDVPRQASSEQGASNEKQSEQITEDSPTQCGQKRQRSDDNASGEATTNLQGQLVEILDRSSQMVAAQLEAQNVNSRLNREQRKDQVSSLLGVLGKVADALYRIADEL